MITPIESSKVPGTEVCYREYKVTCDACGRSVIQKDEDDTEEPESICTATLKLGNRSNVFKPAHWAEVSFEFCRGGNTCFLRAVTRKLNEWLARATEDDQ